MKNLKRGVVRAEFSAPMSIRVRNFNFINSLLEKNQGGHNILVYYYRYIYTTINI